MDDIANKINNTYKKLSYLDKYGGSIVMTILILFIFFVILSYFSVIKNIEPIKKDWNNQKCSPSVIPFAGIINKPDNMSAFDFTSKNFTGCINNILEAIAREFIKPINNTGKITTNALKSVINSVNSIRNRIGDLTSKFGEIDNEIMNKIMAFLQPIRYMLIKIKDTISRLQAILVTNLYTVLATYLGIKSFIANLVNFLVTGLGIFSGIILALIASFFGIPAAIPLITIYAAVAIPTIYLIVNLNDIIEMTNRSVPKTPSIGSCFDEDTPIRMINGTYKSIKDIYPNEILYGNILVTSTMKLSSLGITMYKYKDTIVSGKHQVYINGKLTKIEDIPNIEKIENYDKEYIYCLNTDNKIININDEVYADWDEITEGNLYLLYKRLGSKFTSVFNKKDIHKYLDGGFVEGSLITMNDGTKKPIQDIKVNDILHGNSRVYGLVSVTTNSLTVYNNKIQNVEVIGAPNLQVYNENLGHFSHLKPKSTPIPIERKPTKLYHLLTETKRVVVNGASFYDYNGCLDVILQINPIISTIKQKNKSSDEYLTSPQFNSNSNYICRETNKKPGILKRLFNRREKKREKYIKMLAKYNTK